MVNVSIAEQLELLFRDAFTKVGVKSDVPVVLKLSTRDIYGDYQVNGIMGAAKILKLNPRELAQKVINNLALNKLILKTEVAGPGFINIWLQNDFLSQYLIHNPAIKPQAAVNIVVDYSSPNLAKEMHVGHLRSTVIGDALVRIYQALGYKVIRRNHVGDWGTQFGMLLCYWQKLQMEQANLQVELSDLEEFYRQAKALFDNDLEFASQSRACVVKLQAQDDEAIKLWKSFVQVSLEHCQEAYTRLKTLLTLDDVVGESFYNSLLKPMVDLLLETRVAQYSEGAVCVFTHDSLNNKLEETPFIVQKKDGAYLYASTDVAAVYDRVNNLDAKRLIYVIDARQSLHMKQLEYTTRKANILPIAVSFEHVAFGTMMGEDGKPFKTRAGGTIKLKDLLDEAHDRAAEIIRVKHEDWPHEKINQLAEKLAIAAIKYADLSKNRLSDYIFSFDKMLSFDGNTAPYLLYAYTRIESVFKKANLNKVDILPENLKITETCEHKLAFHLANFNEIVLQVAKENYPHVLCAYLYDLATLFMRFYEVCLILASNISLEIRNSRLMLLKLTQDVLRQGLDLLGIEAVNEM